VVAYWRGGHLVVENYMTKQRRHVAAGVVGLLDRFGRWRHADAVLDDLDETSRQQMRRLIEELTTGSFLEARGRGKRNAGQSLGAWQPWHPAASFFHFASKDPRFATSARADAAVEKDLRARVSARPSSSKRYRSLPEVTLPPPLASGEFPEVLLSRRTWRRFGAGPIDLQSLSRLLALSFGVQWQVTLGVIGTVFLTTSPSGGGRHPLEAYVVVQNVAGLAPGVYHYRNDRHRLTRIGKPLPRRQIRAFFPGQSWCATAPVVVLLTAVFGRTQWKYPHPRAYRVLLAEAGHVCQTFCLTATWLGLAPFCTMALADSAIDHALGLDGLNESVIYAAGVGRRPKGMRWAPWPERGAVPVARTTGIISQPPLR
jgi:SagB-type dehydrogenase family enzyme